MGSVRVAREHQIHQFTFFEPLRVALKEIARWHGQEFIPTFAHRARIFYDLATRGWDSRLYGGGVT
jgi:hypothetical protein